ncbi:MAG TPA: preprotein translocase subunit SecA [Alphaproteobacteria bacterium]|jgi:preprotein translocase subunit SecA|nr:preprotein translocase subunit SecA [Alphaproteobacteria bacterium]
MFAAVARKLFGNANDRVVGSLRSNIQKINALEPKYQPLSDEELRAQTAVLRGRLAEGETLDDILPDAFAVVREAAKRTLGQRHFDVQLMGGMVLHSGRIAEMKTGEGKTLVATLAVYLNALSSKGVHVVTVNDYLAQRDSGWMGQVYRFLGLTVGCIVNGLDDNERREAYGADVTYGTNNEFGFDYLRDNMKYQLEEMVQRPFNYAIVDEVDSILIDEARTPLIISGPSQDSSELYQRVDAVIPSLGEGDYDKDEKHKTVALNEPGTEKIEELLRQVGLLESGTLYDIHNVSLVHHVNSALRAHKLFTRDVDYIVKDDKVVIIDEFTGRMMVGRRYSEGLHQALEAKEHVTIEKENQTLASITFQNYFRMYPKLAGMTGTAMTEAGEFSEIYKLDVVEMPTNRPVSRLDEDDEVYRTAAEKNAAIVVLIEEAQKRQQPVLVGTVSIEKSEHLSDLLKKKKIKHAVLNARYHEQEATIVAQAGRPGAVTIATNMAGRGTDIQLGGNLEMRVRDEADQLEGEARDKKIAALKAEIEAARDIVKEAGGLYVMGTERHESRRIDNQLRGRSGRQGDPGNSKFFLSLEDDLMRIYGMQRMDGVLQRLGIKEGEAIIHPWINKALERAQKKVEQQHFEVRKNLLKYDDVMNDQRKVIYEQRKEVMGDEVVTPIVDDMRQDVIERVVGRNLPPHSYAEQWNTAGLKDEIQNLLGMELPIDVWAQEAGIDDETMLERIVEAAAAKAADKVSTYGADIMNQVSRTLLLQLLDQSWKEHLLALDHLRQGINLRAYGQRDPLNEYKREAFQLFSDMLDDVREQITRYIANIEFRMEQPDIPPPQPFEMHETRRDPALDMAPGILSSEQAGFAQQQGNVALADEDFAGVSRNAPCPCGSGKKYKHCHGAAV